MSFRSALTSNRLVVADDIVVIMYLTVMIVQNHHVTAVKANKIMPILNKVSNEVIPIAREMPPTTRKIVGATFA